MIGIPYTIQNKNGDSIVINDHSNPDRIIALQQYPGFDVDIKNNESPREGQHGIWDFNSYFGKRLITFQGVIIGKTEADVETVKNNLMNVLTLPIQPTTINNGKVTLKWSDILGDSWQIEAKLYRAVQFSRDMKQTYKLDFTFSLKAPDPFIVGQSLISVTGIRGYTSVGVHFPITLPATVGQNEVGQITIPNPSSVDSYTTIRLYGESAGTINTPTITNLSTGKFFKLWAVIDGADDYIEIDSKNGTVIDKDGNDLSGYIAGGSEFIMLKPGENKLIYKSDEDPQIVLYLPSAPYSVAFRKTKI